MATALELQVEVDDDEAGASDLVTDGEIYLAAPEKATAAGPVVTHVIASPVRTTRFALDAGKYEYRFHVERAGGKFTLTLTATIDDSTVGEFHFDTAYGFEHKVFAFEVK